MPKVSAKKTKSEPKGESADAPKTPAARPDAARRRKMLLYGVGVLLALFALLSPTLFYRPAKAQLAVGGQKISMEIANDAASRELGLGGRKSLAHDAGMIFVFRHASRQCFWMKGMHFPLDMVFISSAKQVVYLEQNVSPNSYPHAYCADHTRYVIELNAGRAAELGIHIGQTLKF